MKGGIALSVILPFAIHYISSRLMLQVLFYSLIPHGIVDKSVEKVATFSNST